MPCCIQRKHAKAGQARETVWLSQGEFSKEIVIADRFVIKGGFVTDGGISIEGGTSIDKRNAIRGGIRCQKAVSRDGVA